MTHITDIHAEEIKDSRGKPTLSVEVIVGSMRGTFAVPSGASTGSAEAHELRDNDGGMQTALAGIRDVITPALVGIEVENQKALDERLLALDGTDQKIKLGGNTMLGVSIAAARCAAVVHGVETFEYLRTVAQITPSRRTPYLYMNYINGGKHAKSPIAFQEHMVVPETEDVAEALATAEKISTALQSLLQEKYGSEAASSMGDEGGFVLPDSGYRKPFEILTEAIARAGQEGKVRIAIDVAASSFFDNGVYAMDSKVFSGNELADTYRELVRDFPILSIEDPFEEESFDDFASLESSVPVRLVGDDLTVTNRVRLQKAIDKKSIKAIIIKPNQIGTLTETLETMQLARAHGIDCIVSHRSGETMDSFVADLAYAFGAFGLKAGALRRPERRVKYERLRTIAV